MSAPKCRDRVAFMQWMMLQKIIVILCAGYNTCQHFVFKTNPQPQFDFADVDRERVFCHRENL